MLQMRVTTSYVIDEPFQVPCFVLDFKRPSAKHQQQLKAPMFAQTLFYSREKNTKGRATQFMFRLSEIAGRRLNKFIEMGSLTSVKCKRDWEMKLMLIVEVSVLAPQLHKQ